MDKKRQQRRDRILGEMRQIERLRQGTISEQFYGSGDNKQGPYYVLQGYSGGKHWSTRVRREHVEQVREDLAAGTHFKELCGQFAELTEEATIAEDQSVSKKNAVKRSRSDTGRPKRS